MQQDDTVIEILLLQNDKHCQIFDAPYLYKNYSYKILSCVDSYVFKGALSSDMLKFMHNMCRANIYAILS